MSAINLKLATSVTIALVPTSIAGSNTITLPAETGTARTTVSSGTVLQIKNYQTGAMATGTTQMPYDDTIPQNTEGDQYMSLEITPKSATSSLLINVVVYIASTSANTTFQMALFQDSTANALAAGSMYPGGATNTLELMTFNHSMTSGTTSATTFKVRVGSNQASTTTFNGSTSARLMGGVYASSITIIEYVP